jgi:hypothetical protein
MMFEYIIYALAALFLLFVGYSVIKFIVAYRSHK